MADLSFSVKLQMLNDEFNANIREASNQFTTATQAITSNLVALKNNSQTAESVLSHVFNAQSDNAVHSIEQATTALNGMGQGANVTAEQMQNVFRVSAQHVTELEQKLVQARGSVQQLFSSNASGTAITQAVASVHSLETELAQAQTASSNLSSAMANAMNRATQTTEQASNAVHKLFGVRTDSTINAEIGAINSALTTLKDKFQQGAVSEQEFTRMTQAGQQKLQALDNELKNTSNDMNKVGESAKKSNSGMEKLGGGFTALKTAIGAYLGLDFLKHLASTADAYTSMTARLKVAVGATGDLQGAMAGVQSVAMQTNSSLEATTMLFTKVNDVGKQMGLTQQQSLGLTKTINQAMQIGGASAQASEDAVIQLTQSLQSGVLRGDEFNSIMEQAPGISKALAASLGVTTGELRKMAENGQLSATTVIKALQQQSANIQADFDKFPKTIGQALQSIKTQWEVVVGEFNTESGASKVVVDALNIIKDNLGYLKNVFNDVGSGVKWFSDKLGSIDPSTINTLKATLSQAYDTVKELAKSIADMGETVWEAFKSTLDSISPLFAAFTSGQQATSGLDTALNVLRLGMGILSDGAKEFSIVLNMLLGGLQTVASGILLLDSKVAGFFGFKDLSKQAEEASDKLYEAGQKSIQRANQQALEFKSSTVKAWDDMHKTEEQKNAESVASTQKTLQDKSKALADYVGTERDFGKERADLDKQLQEARKNGDKDTVTTLTKNIADLDTEAQASAAKRAKLEKDKTDAVQQFAEQSINANHGVVSEQLKAELATQGYTIAVDKAGKVSVKAMEDSSKEGYNLGLTLDDAAKKAAQGLGIDVKGALNELNPAFVRNKEEVEKVADGYNALKDKGLDAGNLLRASLDKMLEGAKSQKEIDTVTLLYMKFGKQGKLSADQVKAGLEETKEKNIELQKQVTGVANAYRQLGLQTSAELKKTANDNKRAYDEINNDVTASKNTKLEAFEKTVQSAIAADDKTMISSLKSQAVARGYGDVITENGKLVFKTAQDIKAIEDKEAQEAAERTKARIEQAHEQVEAVKKAEEAEANAIAESTAKQKAALESMGAFMDGVTNSMKAKFTAVGLTADEASKAFNKMNLAMNGMGKQWADFGSWINDMNTLNHMVEKEANAFAEVKTAAENATTALGNNDATSQDLANAQNVLYQATNASIQGIKRMDSQTLHNLQNAIDSTKEKMQSLAQTALQTEQDLEASLASAKGDDSLSLKLEQTRKLDDLQTKLQEAQKRGNADEIAHYQHAIELQNQLNSMQTAQAQQKAQQAAQEALQQAAQQAAQNKAVQTITNTQKVIAPNNIQPTVPAIITPPANTKPVETGSSGKTINVNLQLAGKTLNATVPAEKEADIEAFLKALEQSQAVSGK